MRTFNLHTKKPIMKTHTTTTTKPAEGTQAVKLTHAQKMKLTTLSIKLLDAGFYGEELKEIMARAVSKVAR